VGLCIAAAISPAGALATTTSTATVKRASGKLSLSLTGTSGIRGGQATTANRAVRVSGVVRPYVSGQFVVIHAFMGHMLILNKRVGIRRSPGGTFGEFSSRLQSRGSGLVFISVVHDGSTTLERLVGYSRFEALDPQYGYGSSGPFIQLIQSRLRALHIFDPQSGVFDSYMALALDAYHRLLGWGASQSLDAATVASLMAGVGAFHIRDPGAGKHAEGDLATQLLALAYGADVYAIYPISSGKPSTPTVIGHFAVYSKVPGYLPDGMYFSNFFTGGYAIHGYDPAPDYPASHGCMRVPIQDAVSIYDWLDIGNVVDTYY
jgi:hypothetical protein